MPVDSYDMDMDRIERKNNKIRLLFIFFVGFCSPVFYQERELKKKIKKKSIKFHVYAH